MADKMTGTNKGPIDRATGFGANEQKSENAEKIADLLDQARDLMIEDGTDPATAEALTNFARPNSPQVAGNLADLMRMGQIAATGQIETPPGEDNVEASNLEDAFVELPPPDLNPGRQTPMGQIDAEGKGTGANVGDEAKGKGK